jgi:large subunit ribosomal protein L32
MAVPKKKKSMSRSGMRRGSNGTFKADFPNVVADKTTGEFKISHHISSDGYYKGRRVVMKKAKKSSQ